MSGEEREGVCVLLKELWMIVADEILKASCVETRTEFMWAGVKWRVQWCIIQFIL